MPERTGDGEFRAACAREDLPAAARALLRWARRERPALRNLGELAQSVSDKQQAALLGELERALYGAGGNAGSGLAASLAKAFRSGPAFVDPRKPRADQPVLPELYPFRI